ncbi:MAG: ExeM/NucH family extracellular endonuclease [Bacteroidetes bacterium]|nr:MAG: ExeM/NucH family extracellular endonuclease [Bacteroidota bacterium]
MSKNLLFLLLSFCLFRTISFAQVVVFSENFGTPSGTTAANSYTGYQNNGKFIATSNGGSTPNPDIRTSSASTGYTGVSGSGNLFFGTAGGSGVVNDRQVTIIGINTSSMSNILMTFGVRWESTTGGLGLILEQSTDNGASWDVLNFTNPVFNSWILATVTSSISQSSNLALRFTRQGNARGYRIDDINIINFASSSANFITEFTLANTNANISGNFITVTVPSGTSLNPLTATGVISNLVTVNPAFSSSLDYSLPVTFTVTAQNLSTNIYTVTAFVNPVNVADNFITSFTAQNQASSTISGNNIFVSFPNGSNINSLNASGVIASNATVSPAFNVVQNFNNLVFYTVTAQNLSTNVYTVTSSILPPSAINITPIYTIQGSGMATSLLSNQVITTSGVVTASFQNSTQLSGFYIQDKMGDGNSQTSDGIFVFVASSPLAVNVGDEIMLSANAVEFNGATQLTNPILRQIISTGNNIVPTNVTLPGFTETEFEKYEGMLVTFTQELTVTQNFFLGRFGRLLLSSGGRLFNPTNVFDVNDSDPNGNSTTGGSNLATITAQLNLNKRRCIVMDDGSTLQNPSIVPYLDPVLNTIRCGSTVLSLTGVVDYFSNASNSRFEDLLYRIHPTIAPTINYAPRPSVPGVGMSNVKIGSLNVLNYFNGDGTGSDAGFGTSEQRGASNLVEFNRQKAKIISAIQNLNADVLGIMEMENDGEGPNHAIVDLISGLNTAMGAGTYNFVTSPGVGGKLGTDAIKVGLIYKPATLDLVGNSMTSTDAVHSRPPLAQIFKLKSTNANFMVVSSHFKSKSPGNPPGSGLDADMNDGQGFFNNTRKNQAISTTVFAKNMADANNITDYLLVGDFNAYEQEDPMDIFRSMGLQTLVNNTYSFVFDGAAGSLDHAVASPSLAAKTTGAHKWHNNADEPTVLDYNTDFGRPAYVYDAGPYRSSDHDALIVGLNLQSISGLTITGISSSKVYGQPNPIFNYSVAGLQIGDNINVILTTTATGSSNIGTHPIAISVTGNNLSNYELTIFPALLTITKANLTVSANNTNRVYGQPNPIFTGNIIGVVNGDIINATYTSTATGASGVGTHPIAISVTGNKLSNYELTTVLGLFTITKANLTVSANNANRVYGQPNPIFTGNIVGVVNGDIINATYTSTATGSSGVGTHPIAISVTGNKLSNYELTTVLGLLTITKAAQTISGFGTLTDITLPGITSITLSATASSGLPVEYSVSGLAFLNNTTLSLTGTGLVSVIAIQVGNENFEAATSISQSFTVFTVLSSIQNLTSTNLPTYQSTSFSVYPNPVVNGEWRIENGELGATMYVFNAQGAIVYTQTITSASTEVSTKLSSGIYLVKVGKQSVKLVVE